jgi:glc operon protein GlcG
MEFSVWTVDAPLNRTNVQLPNGTARYRFFSMLIEMRMLEYAVLILKLRRRNQMLRKINHPILVFVFFLLVALNALAQAPATTAPPSTPYGTPVSLDDAKKAAAAAIAEARKNNWTMAVAIVDPSGLLVYFEKMDGTQNGSVEVSIEKARTSALFRRPSKSFQDALAAGGEGLRLLRLTGAMPVDGGTPIIVGGRVVGAVGVSGGSGEQDGRVAAAGAGSLK